MPESNSNPVAHPAAQSVDQLLKKCDIKRTRGSGPGGQHRNKVETAIVITHRPTGIVGQASERRSQADNHRQAVARLRINLAVAHRVLRVSKDGTDTDGVEKYQPSELWKSRVKSKRINISPGHDDFPAMLAEALDVIAVFQTDVGEAAKKLDCSSSQLVKLLKKERTALEWLNQKRREFNLPLYK